MAADFSKILDPRKYEYLTTLGTGSFATAIKARHVPLDVPVVVKILHRDAEEIADAPERFRIEAQAMAKLSSHPNVPDVLDYGTTEDGRPFFSMRFLEGRSLDEELREREILGARANSGECVGAFGFGGNGVPAPRSAPAWPRSAWRSFAPSLTGTARDASNVLRHARGVS